MNEKRWKVKIKTLSPVHIGNGEIIDPTDYIAKNGYVYFLNQSEYLPYLIRKKESLLAQALDSANQSDIIRIMVNHFDSDIRHHWKFRIKVSDNFCELWKNDLKDIKRSQQLHCFIRNSGNCSPFLPASSLKGVLRTAILYNQSKNDSKKVTIDKLDKKDKYMPQEMEAVLLDAEKNGRLDICNDPLKFLKVEDAILKNEDIFLDKILRYGMVEEEMPVYYEMLLPDSEAVFEVKIGENAKKYIPDLPGILRNFSTKLLQKEREWMTKNDAQNFSVFSNKLVSLYQQTQGSNCALVRFGFGSSQWGLSLPSFWKDSLKTKAIWNWQQLGWVLMTMDKI